MIKGGADCRDVMFSLVLERCTPVAFRSFSSVTFGALNPQEFNLQHEQMKHDAQHGIKLTTIVSNSNGSSCGDAEHYLKHEYQHDSTNAAAGTENSHGSLTGSLAFEEVSTLYLTHQCSNCYTRQAGSPVLSKDLVYSATAPPVQREVPALGDYAGRQ